jgi:Putative esterase
MGQAPANPSHRQYSWEVRVFPQPLRLLQAACQSIGALLTAALVSPHEAHAAAASRSTPMFTVSIAQGVPAQAHAASEQAPSQALDGRVYIIVSHAPDPEPRLQQTGLDANGAPFWGLDVDNFRPGQSISFSAKDPRVYGFPMADLQDLTSGTYYVQALMNTYETFTRADGSVVKLHMPCGDGHRIAWSTGNIYSDVQKVSVGHRGPTVALELKHVILPYEPVPKGGTCQQGNPPDTAHVRFLKVKSDVLSRFWGRPIYIAARVILPHDYAQHPTARYPVIFGMNHHPRAYELYGNHSSGFYVLRDDGDDPLSQWWLSDKGPEVIVVQPYSETPYYDTSYWVNSANVGPYGDALLDELLPAINKQFRTIDKRWARTLTGCSSGGWMSAAAQVLYPRVFGGAFIFAPDIVDLRSLWLINLYTEPNAYFNETEWRRWERPYIRDPDTGDTLATTGDWAHLELALGDKRRSGEYFAQLDATWSAIGADGYPVPKWDPRTGVIDHNAVRASSRFDLSVYLENNWAKVEPLLRGGRLQFFVTETDNYYTNLAVHLLEARLKTVSPASDAGFHYFPSGAHCRTPISQQELVMRMVEFMQAHSNLD